MADYLTKKDGVWLYVRRVPDDFATLDKRKFVKQSTGIRVADDPRKIKAKREASRINAITEAYWHGLVDGKSAEVQLRYDAARKRARMMRLSYMPAEELAKAPLEEIISRIALLNQKGLVDDEPAITAVLGGEKPPPITISTLFETYRTAVRSSLTDMSPNQIRKWENPRKKAVKNLISVIGDKQIAAITRDDALSFREYWQERIVQEELTPDSANKDIGHISKMLRIIDDLNRFNIGPIFGNLRLAGEGEGQRIAYDSAFVQERLLAKGAFDELNEEARRVIYLIADTGLRPSEAVNLDQNSIHLDVAVPFVSVAAEGRRTKTKGSVREIPLVGCALVAAQAQPSGFPRYRDKSDSLSALVNSYFRTHKLSPNGETLYSLRHTFEDRLVDVEPPDKITAILMGHKYVRPKYGAGPSLEQKAKWLQRIAFIPPSRV